MIKCSQYLKTLTSNTTVVLVTVLHDKKSTFSAGGTGIRVPRVLATVEIAVSEPVQILASIFVSQMSSGMDQCVPVKVCSGNTTKARRKAMNSLFPDGCLPRHLSSLSCKVAVPDEQ